MKYSQQLIKLQTEENKARAKEKEIIGEVGTWTKESVENSDKFVNDVLRPIQKNLEILKQIVSLESQLNDCN